MAHGPAEEEVDDRSPVGRVDRVAQRLDGRPVGGRLDAALPHAEGPGVGDEGLASEVLGYGGPFGHHGVVAGE